MKNQSMILSRLLHFREAFVTSVIAVVVFSTVGGSVLVAQNERTEKARPLKSTLTLDVTPRGAGTVRGGGDYTPGTVVTIGATPRPNYHFSRWQGLVQGPTDPETQTYVGSDSIRITAVFVREQRLIRPRIEPVGSGKIEGSGWRDHGLRAVPLRAVPEDGFEFVGWSGPVTDVRSITTILKGVLESDIEVTARFAPLIREGELTLIAGEGGTVEGAGRYPLGTPVVIKAIAAPGYIFNGWRGDGIGTPSSAESTVIVGEGMTLSASFIRIYAFIKVVVEPLGAGEVTGSTGMQPCDLPAEIKAVAAPRYQFSGWSGPVANRNQAVTTVTPAKNGVLALTAHFKPAP